jgi:membrane fusion protein (multidrug efflux system)
MTVRSEAVKKRRWLVVSALPLVLLAACKKAETHATVQVDDPAVHVQTVQAALRPMPEYLTVTGSLSANEESEVAADASGKVIATLVDRGSVVKKGDVIARLDARTASLNAAAATAQSHLAERRLELSKLDCDRIDKLFEAGAVSRAEYDRQTAQCALDKLQAEAATANQGLATKTVGDATIRAPFAGIVGERFVNVGQYVQPSTKVVSLYQTDPLRLVITVPEANVAAVKEGMPVAFRVAAYGDETFTGSVKFVSPYVRQASRDLVVEALANNPEGKLKPGMFASVRLLLSEKPVPSVPATAVKKDDATARVFAVRDGRIDERVVQLGEQKDGFYAVLSGVQAGDALVSNPGADVRDGVRVQ